MNTSLQDLTRLHAGSTEPLVSDLPETVGQAATA